MLEVVNYLEQQHEIYTFQATDKNINTSALCRGHCREFYACRRAVIMNRSSTGYTYASPVIGPRSLMMVELVSTMSS